MHSIKLHAASCFVSTGTAVHRKVLDSRWIAVLTHTDKHCRLKTQPGRFKQGKASSATQAVKSRACKAKNWCSFSEILFQDQLINHSKLCVLQIAIWLQWLSHCRIRLLNIKCALCKFCLHFTGSYTDTYRFKLLSLLYVNIFFACVHILSQIPTNFVHCWGVRAGAQYVASSVPVQCSAAVS